MKLNLKKTILAASILIALAFTFVSCRKDTCLPRACSFDDGQTTTNCSGVCDLTYLH
jgi:hypothetical protein